MTKWPTSDKMVESTMASSKELTQRNHDVILCPSTELTFHSPSYSIKWYTVPVSKGKLVCLCSSCQSSQLISHTDAKYWLPTLAFQHLKNETQK